MTLHYIVYQGESDEFSIEVPDDARVYITSGGYGENSTGVLKVVRDIERKRAESEDYTNYETTEHVLAQYPDVNTIRCVDQVTRTERELA
jgi:hypothetical protein